MSKQLHIAIDIYDEFIHNDHFLTQENLQQLMQYCRSLGATAVNWVVDDMWAIYETYPGRFDLLKVAADCAHEQGLKFNAVYKPFENGLHHFFLPHSVPRNDGPALAWEDGQGVFPVMRPFVAQNPQFCMKRKAGDEDPGGCISQIRIFKNDNEPVDLSADDLSIWTSNVNGTFKRYDGPFTMAMDAQWRPMFPLGQTCHMIRIEGLAIPADQRFIEVRLSSGAMGSQTFENEPGQIVELINDDGATVPNLVAAADPVGDVRVKQLAEPTRRAIVRLCLQPQVSAYLDDAERIAATAGENRAYQWLNSDRLVRFSESGRVSIMRSKPTYLFASLNPVYKEVRDYWLSMVQYCVDRGADSVNLRSSTHIKQQESWAYGYNDPVLEVLGDDVSQPGVSRVMGDAYSQFIAEAGELLHDQGKTLGVHLLTNDVLPRDEGPRWTERFPVDFQWRDWLPAADLAIIRGAMGLRWNTNEYVTDLFADACKAADVPVIYQSNRRSFVGRTTPTELAPDRFRWLEHELQYAMTHPRLHGFELYETANFTHYPDGQFAGSEQIRALCEKHGFLAGE